MNKTVSSILSKAKPLFTRGGADIMEKVLVATLCGLAIWIFAGWNDKGLYLMFSGLSLGLLIAWRFAALKQMATPLPGPMLAISMLYVLTLIIGALISDNGRAGFTVLKHYHHLFIGGLLLTVPLRDHYRKKIIVVFFASAALAAMAGLAQAMDLLRMDYPGRVYGFSGHPNIYAGVLALVCNSAIILFLLPHPLFRSKKDRFFLAIVAVLTLSGLVLSQTRGMWVALVASCVLTLFLYDRKKAFLFFVSVCILAIVAFSASGTLRQRAFSIVSSVYTEDSSGSTGNRIVLWKGALLIVREHPLLGTGTGDFQSDINKLIQQKKLADIPNTLHGHNMFLHVLATRGLIGFASLIALYGALLYYGILSREQPAAGGALVVATTILTMVGCLTDNYLEVGRYLAGYCLLVGLFGFSTTINTQTSAQRAPD